MKKKFLNNLRLGFAALIFTVIAFFFLNTRESSYVTTDSDEHLITAHFIENDLSLTGTLGENGSEFSPLFILESVFPFLLPEFLK